eukprot:gene1089-2120_t
MFCEPAWILVLIGFLGAISWGTGFGFHFGFSGGSLSPSPLFFCKCIIELSRLQVVDKSRSDRDVKNVPYRTT